MNNIVLVNLESTYASAYGIWQWDYGQILRIQSKKKLPKAVEVHFSEQEKGGSSITRIGTTADNVTDVPIPDSLLEKSGNIYAFVYIEDGQSGNTEYKIEMSVKARPKPEIPGSPEEPELFKETIKAVNEAADRAETAEQNANDSASKAEEAAASASASAKAAENTKTEALEEIGNKKQDALSSIQAKKEESLSAIRTQEENSVSKVTEHTNEEIQRFQNVANESKGTLDRSIEEASEKKTSLDSSIQTADSSKANLDESIQNAGSAKSGLDASTGKAKDAKTELDGSIQTAGEKQAALDTIVGKAEELDTSLAKNIESGTQLQKELVASGEKAVQDIQSAGTEQLDKMQTVADEFEADREQVNVNKENIASLTEDLGDINASVFNIEESPNIFDKTKIYQDKALVTWGTPTMTNYAYDRTGWITSYPIAVRGGSTIHVYKFENGVIKNQNIANLITFAKDGTFIAVEGQNKSEIKLGDNTAYIIFDISNSSFVDSLMLTTEPYNGVYQAYGVKKEDKIAKNAEDILKLKNDKTHIIFSFDAFKIDNRFELMKSYGFPFTIAIASTILTYPISKEDFYNYFIDGNVDFSVYGGKGDRPSDYRNDKDKWSSWVKDLVDGLKETSGLYYPVMYSCQNGASSDILNQVVKENGFKMCRNGTYYNADGTTTWGILTDRKYLIDGTKYFDYYPLSVVKQDGYPTVEEIKTEIDNAIEKKKSIMLFTHYVKEDSEEMSDTDCPLSKFTAVLDYVKEKVDAGLCDVKNARQFWNYYNQQDGSDIDYKRTNMRNLFDTTN